MQSIRQLSILIVTLCLAGFLSPPAASAAAQEHPRSEHPKQTAPAAKSISMPALEKAIRDQISEKAKASGGKFPVRDGVLNKDWRLDLVNVHTDKLTQLDDKTYFACVDMKADDGTIVDVDFFVKNEDGKLALAETTVHKTNGQPRYTWQKKGNFWERVSLAR